MNPALSVIVPAFNEEGNVEAVLQRIDEGLRTAGVDGEIVFIDDGSTDATWSKLEAARAARPNLRAFRHRRNLGRSEALNTGFRSVRGDFVIFLPADLQSNPAEDSPKIMAELRRGEDVVVGWRIGRMEGKLFVSLVYNWLSRRLFGVDAHDLNWIKGFRREVIDAVHLRSDWHRYMVVLAAGRGFRVKEIRTNYYPRHSGKSKFGRKRILRGVLDLLVVKFETAFRDKPMLLFGSWGFALLAAAFVLGVGIVVQKIVTGAGSRPLLFLVMTLLSLGVQLVGLGFVSEQVASLRDALARERAERRDPGDGGR